MHIGRSLAPCNLEHVSGIPQQTMLLIALVEVEAPKTAQNLFCLCGGHGCCSCVHLGDMLPVPHAI